MKKSHYRLTGILYLIVIGLAGTSQGYIREGIVVAGNALKTVEQMMANEFLYRLALTFDLTAFIIDAIISILLYQMFKDHNRILAACMAGLRLIAHPAIGSLNLLNHHLAIQLVQDPGYLGAFSEQQLASLSMLFIEAHQYGYLIAGGFFAFHCLLLGLLIHQTKRFPKLLGSLLILAAAGYLIETYCNFMTPDYADYTAMIVGLSAAIGEISFTVYLLVKGRKQIIG